MALFGQNKERELESHTRKMLLKGKIGISAGQDLPLCKDELGDVTLSATATRATPSLLCSRSDSSDTATATTPTAEVGKN